MRCCACDAPLTDKEATRKSPVTGDYLDMCNICLGSIASQIPDSFNEDDELLDDEMLWEESLEDYNPSY